jgi:hypothetical protein
MKKTDAEWILKKIQISEAALNEIGSHLHDITDLSIKKKLLAGIAHCWDIQYNEITKVIAEIYPDLHPDRQDEN